MTTTGLKRLAYKERLRELGLLTMGKGRLRDLINAYKYQKDGSQEVGAGLFSVVCSDRTKGNGHKRQHRKFHQNTRKNFFTVRVTSPGTGCPERWWSLLPWRCSRPSWMLSCTVCCKEPASARGRTQ